MNAEVKAKILNLISSNRAPIYKRWIDGDRRGYECGTTVYSLGNLELHAYTNGYGSVYYNGVEIGSFDKDLWYAEFDPALDRARETEKTNAIDAFLKE